MATTTNKQKLLTHLFAAFKKAPESTPADPLPVLEQFIFGLCRQNATREQAETAFRNLRERFFDWNEIRVSSDREVADALEDLPDAEQQAQRIIAFLQEVFEKEFSFDLERLHKKGVKQAHKALTKHQAADDYVCAWVVQRTLEGHAIPVDAPTLRCTRRLGLLDSDIEDVEAQRTSLEHLV